MIHLPGRFIHHVFQVIENEPSLICSSIYRSSLHLWQIFFKQSFVFLVSPKLPFTTPNFFLSGNQQETSCLQTTMYDSRGETIYSGSFQEWVTRCFQSMSQPSPPDRLPRQGRLTYTDEQIQGKFKPESPIYPVLKQKIILHLIRQQNIAALSELLQNA